MASQTDLPPHAASGFVKANAQASPDSAGQAYLHDPPGGDRALAL